MQHQEADLIIRGGDVIDGTGGPKRRADVALADGRITAVGDLTGAPGKREIDASGMAVAPGFIDVHTHDDSAVFSYPAMTPKVSQGVTTVITGNCGISLAPFTYRERPADPAPLLGGPEEYRFPKMADYRAAFEDSPAALNVAMLAGHSTLRIDAMGNDIDRPATADEIARMADALDEALDAGAIGMSTGLAYPSARFAPTDEVVELAKRLGARGAVYTTHMRDEGDGVIDSIDETVRIGAESGARMVISHHKCVGKQNWGRSVETLARIDAARGKYDIDLDVYPYVASSSVLLPEWLDEHMRVIVTWTEAHPEMAGRDLAEIAEEWDVDRVEAAKRLLPAGAIYFKMAEEDLRRIMAHRRVMIGSDGIPFDPRPHPRLWGTFPRVLGHYARDVQLLSLEEAVHRMTGLSAQVFGLTGRGVIAEDAHADITVFDPATVRDVADFENSMEPAEGIAQVIVGGETVWDGTAATGARPGRFLAHGG